MKQNTSKWQHVAKLGGIHLIYQCGKIVDFIFCTFWDQVVSSATTVVSHDDKNKRKKRYQIVVVPGAGTCDLYNSSVQQSQETISYNACLTVQKKRPVEEKEVKGGETMKENVDNSSTNRWKTSIL